jgi:asparagine synthase (glutamine-hydrolysing)
VPLSSWFRGDLRDRVQEAVLARDAPVRRYFAPGALESTVDDHLSGRVDRSAQIWALLMLSEWHQAERQPATSGPTGLGIGAR